VPIGDIFLIISFASSGETVIKRSELISEQLFDVRAAQFSDYSYPVTKSSNWTAVIGHPLDYAPITYQISAENQSQ